MYTSKEKLLNLFCLVSNLLLPKHSEKECLDLSFPSNFSLGVATANYQVEGAWNEDGRGESTWDRFVHSRNITYGDIAADFYHKYKEDILLLKELGVNHFRFSLGWSRILPTGSINNVNQKGVQFYHNVLDELIKYNITPVVTIYHFDHPQALEDFGGWLNESMIDAYVDYARFVFAEYGSKAKIFTTISEPFALCKIGYGFGLYPPGKRNLYVNEYLCYTNTLKAHALAYHIYDKEYRHKYHGQVGIVDVCYAMYNDNPTDSFAKDVAFSFDCGITLNPIFSEKGNFPDIVLSYVAERSALQGYNKSRLAPLSDEWANIIRGSSDYLGLNHYSSMLVKTAPREEISKWKNDTSFAFRFDPSWTETSIPLFPENPDGMGVILRKIRDEYKNPPVYIFENGDALPKTASEDRRINFFYNYMKEMLIAMKRDNCNVQMYTAWSFVDTFEIFCGQDCKFGLVEVDFDDVNRTRKIKKSFSWYQSVIKARRLLSPSSWQKYDEK